MLIAKIQIGNASSSHGTGPTANSESRPTRKPVSASQRSSRPELGEEHQRWAEGDVDDGRDGLGGAVA